MKVFPVHRKIFNNDFTKSMVCFRTNREIIKEEAAQIGGGKTASPKTSAQLACNQRTSRKERNGEEQSAWATPPDVGMKPVEEEEEEEEEKSSKKTVPCFTNLF